MAKQTHVHKLKRHKYNTGNQIFFCTLPDCNYKVDVALALGKKSLCNICGDEFIMSEYTIKLVKPHCTRCGKVKVTDQDGATRYVRKTADKVLLSVATDTTDNLRNRLESVVSSTEEDI